jgi:hypothetical protein
MRRSTRVIMTSRIRIRRGVCVTHPEMKTLIAFLMRLVSTSTSLPVNLTDTMRGVMAGTATLAATAVTVASWEVSGEEDRLVVDVLPELVHSRVGRALGVEDEDVLAVGEVCGVGAALRIAVTATGTVGVVAGADWWT